MRSADEWVAKTIGTQQWNVADLYREIQRDALEAAVKACVKAAIGGYSANDCAERIHGMKP